MAESKKQEVVSVEEELAMQAKTAAALERPIGGAISLRAGQISWQGNPIPGNRLRCVILDAIFENRWYTKPFNAEQPSNPDCFALASEEKDLAPHEEAENPQGGTEGTCATCPKGAWGSDPRGGRGKACGQIRRMVLLPSSALENEKTIKDSEIAILKLPVTSTRYWAAYVNRLAAAEKRPTYAVVTEIYTEPHPKHQFHVYFNMLHAIPNEMIGALRAKIAMSKSYLLAPYAIAENAAPTPEAAKPKKY